MRKLAAGSVRHAVHPRLKGVSCGVEADHAFAAVLADREGLKDELFAVLAEDEPETRDFVRVGVLERPRFEGDH